jgi:hypothetical protein
MTYLPPVCGARVDPQELINDAPAEIDFEKDKERSSKGNPTPLPIGVSQKKKEYTQPKESS